MEAGADYAPLRRADSNSDVTCTTEILRRSEVRICLGRWSSTSDARLHAAAASS